MNEQIKFSVYGSPGLGYEAKAVDYSIFTQAETYRMLEKNIEEAIAVHFDDGIERSGVLIWGEETRIP